MAASREDITVRPRDRDTRRKEEHTLDSREEDIRLKVEAIRDNRADRGGMGRRLRRRGIEVERRGWREGGGGVRRDGREREEVEYRLGFLSL